MWTPGETFIAIQWHDSAPSFAWCNAAHVVVSDKHKWTLNELTSSCSEWWDAKETAEWKAKKGLRAGSFGGPQKKEREREETRGDWSLFVRRLGRLDLDQRLRVKTPFEDVFPHLTLSALRWVGISPPTPTPPPPFDSFKTARAQSRNGSLQIQNCNFF